MDKAALNLRLLPNYFKRISIGLLVVSFLIVVMYKYTLFTLPIEKELVKEIAKSGLLISLLTLAITRNKVEDELTIRIRYDSFAVSFFMGCTLLAISPFMNLLFRKSFLTDMDAFQIILTMLFIYFLRFYSYKKNR